MLAQVGCEPFHQAEHRVAVAPGGGRRHEQLAVDDLVSLTVVRQRANHLGGPAAGCMGHAHKVPRWMAMLQESIANHAMAVSYLWYQDRAERSTSRQGRATGYCQGHSSIEVRYGWIKEQS